MSQAHQRGLLLLQQGRFDLADREFRQQLTEDPEDPLAHAFLSLCLTRARKQDEALREADEAVRCGPTLAFCHYVKGSALQGKDRLAEAQTAANQAIQLDPTDADYPALLASIAMERRDWTAALEAANRGLALDAEHVACLNLRAMALVQMGRKAEAAETLGSALADDPENALTHTNQGWALLHQGEHVKALEHFREALRIDPDMEWARAGIVEALKARFLIYRVMLGFFLWMGRQTVIVQWVVILGIVFGQQILDQLSKMNPALQPFFVPIIALSFAFVLMTWISSPLFNLTLRFNRFGRLALTSDEKLASTLIGTSFFLALGCFGIFVVTPRTGAFWAMVYFGLMLFPLSVTFRQPIGKPRLLAATYTGVVAMLGALALTLFFLDKATLANFNSFSILRAFLWGSVLSTWLGSFLATGRLSR
jgi:tetratricopeptide (TPR) repeat protein